MRNLFQYFLVSALLFCINSMAIGSGKYWTVTHQWKNNGSYQTEPFRVYGKKWRIHINFTQKIKPEIDYFDAETETFTRIFKYSPRNSQNRHSLVQTIKNKDQGDKFIRIKAKDCPWTITVEQYIDHTDDWLSRKDRKQRLEPIQALGTWSGTGSGKFSFSTDQPLWFIKAAPQQKGSFSIFVRDSENNIVYSAASAESIPEQNCFFYAPGNYTVEIKAGNSPWVIYAYQTEQKALMKP